ncbi:zinc finger protein 462-like [Mastacembelus armatus]|uniref:zinc finger protein 462-like n=1 Tax=Mastacembelus armatus TaxID=205130 RepID=UPI000E458EAE|nr:zinc finger protein 462-like [Mastacembelus armatus]
MSTTNTKWTLNSANDLKTYKRPSQGTITQYFPASSGSNGDHPGTLSDDTKGTLTLTESPSSSSPQRGDVFKVTANPKTDISRRISDRFLLNDHLLISKEEFGQCVPNNTGKRTINKSSISYPVKRAKPDKEDTKFPEKTDSNGEQPSSIKEFSFVVSEDEDESKANLVHGDTEIPTVYFCKHCDYSDVTVTHVSTHYQNHHPYIQYNTVYIQDPSDQSATFRCLECPVEFLHVADLKIHYKENHPGAPDVFAKQSHELCLVFKCFVCPFITDELDTLKNHYKEIHPTHKVDSSLFYCRYSANRCKEGSSLLNICENTPSPENLEGISPERLHTPHKDVAPQCPTSKGADVALYQCSNCRFSHKSLVVMHVHYQKSHPDQAVTIDKIKKSDHVKLLISQMMPEMTQEPKTIIEDYTLQANTSESSKKAEDTPELSVQKTPVRSKHTEDSQTYSESPIIKKSESAEDRIKTKKSPTSRMSAGMDKLSSSSPNKMFYCQFCSYSNSNIRSVVGHHNAKHSLNGAVGIQEIVHYSAKLQKCQGDPETSESTSSASRTSNQVEVWRKNELQREKDEAHASGARFNAYECAENLFYCQKCNFGNPTIKGIVNHQTQIHHHINFSRESIIEHTALIHAEIEKSKTQTKAFSFATHLPLPFLNEGDENMFFCHFCNYRQSSVNAVLKHYFKRHRGYEVKSEQIHLYTSVVLEQTQKLHLNTAKQQEVSCATLGKKEKVKNFNKSFAASPSLRALTLQCHRCSYATRFVCLLRRHMWKAHRANRSVNEVLRGCFNQGALQTGYHCDWCVFSHTNAAVLYEHYREQHPGRKISLKYISTQLYVGPDASKKKKPQVQHTYDTDSNGSEGNLSSQRSGQNESRVYSCKACPFKGNSMSDITCHYRAVHPWSVKEDGSVLDVIKSKKLSANSQWEDQNEIPASFDSYQVPLEYDTLPDASHEETTSPTMLKCPYCPANFHNQHGLSTHCGMKHPQAVTENVNAQKEQQIQIQKHLHVFQCPYCAYVNTSYQGIRTHCQMKHPAFVSRAESLHVDGTHLHSLDDCVKQKGSDGTVRLSGYICKTCSQIFATLEKLNMHRKKNHKTDSVPKTLKPAPKPSAMRKIQQYKCHSTQGSVSKASFLRKKIYAVIRCQQCNYRCSTKIALSRHLHIHYRNASVSNVSEYIYKCALCSRTFYRKKHLGSHYTKKHGQDAFLKYYAPVYEQIPQKVGPTSSECHSTRQQENISEPCRSSKMTEKNGILVYKCPSCPYVNVSYHGTLTHCQMKHPVLVARADELQTDEIADCSVGKGSNKRGYMCKKCQQIYASIIKLKRHCERDHDEDGPAVSDCSDEIKTKPDYSFQGSKLQTASLKNKTGVNTSETNLSQPLGTAETCQSVALSTQNKEARYECCMCSYTGLCRKYLYCHYKNAHKLDGLSTCKLLEKYYKRKRRKTSDLPSTESEENTDVKCKNCPNLLFNSLQLLIAHYGTFHRSECKLDFTVVSKASKRSTGVYKCAHCKKQIYGVKKLSCHLDRHIARWNRRFKAGEKKAAFVFTSPEAKPIKLCKQNELLMLDNVTELAQWDVTPAETFTLPPAPGLLPSKFSDTEQPELQSRKDEHICEQCGRTFKSLKGLRSHERSHAAVAAIKKLDNLPTSALKYNINKYVLYKAGITRPFLCRFCCYRTTVMGLWRSHFMKKHREVIMGAAESDSQDESVRWINKEPAILTEEMNSLPEPDEKLEMSEKSLYLEPPDVQRQLNQFSWMTQTSFSSKANLQETVLPESSLLYCEICSFSSEHLSSLRRHYQNRHGKRMLRCKDCDFITGTRKTLEMHMESGHSTCQSEPTHEKGLRCPFCLYQTKNKNSMIDHIILHREKRVVPIDVRRPKLSRYLQGIIFRCHKCTFSSGSAENLHVHMMRHNDIKPYKCRLCYFDCSQLSDLEAHLSDKHQVLRNHELVGQVSLDELEESGRMPEAEPLSNSEHNNSDCGDMETEEMITDCNEVPQNALAKNMVENTVRDKMTLQMKTNQKYDQGPEGGVAKHRQEKIQAQHKLKHGVDSSMQFTSQTEQVAEGSSTCKIPEKAQAHKLQIKTLQQRILKIEARGNDAIPRHIPALDEDGGICNIQEKVDQDGTVKVEKNIETDVVNNVLSDNQLLDKKSSIILGHSPTNHAKMKLVSPFKVTNHMRANDITTRKSWKVEKQLLNFTPNLGVPFTKCKEEQVHKQRNTEEITEPYGEMPELKNEYLKEDKESEMITERVKNQCKDKKQERDGTKETDKPHVHRGTYVAADVAAEALCPSVAHKKKYSCEFCGRNLMNSYELERHVLRHGM